MNYNWRLERFASCSLTVRFALSVGFAWLLAGGQAATPLDAAPNAEAASAEQAPATKSNGPRVLPEGKLPDDHRLGPLQNFEGYFPFTPSATREAWEQRAERVRRQVLVATGLWPMPSKTPDHAVVHGLVERDDYTVEKVYLESFPGHFVTGNLYRPKGKSGRLPGVLCPYGHWDGGRFNDSGRKYTRKQITEGAERFETAGRFPLQARCVQLARMGCVVFHYDMEGYADSIQIPLAVAHHLTKRRPEMDTPQNWGFFSVQSELHSQTIMGLQTYNSERALDWLLSRDDVDPHRIAVTGASGGGTQTFILAGIDSRVAAACPVVMVSTAMQGGCTCENCCNLRVGTGNIELAGLIAPRPLCLIGADDWTHEIATKGFPELKQLYTLLGAPDDVMVKPLLQFPHNYNYVSREVLYHWLNKAFNLGQEEPIVAEDFKPLSVAEMTVWDAKHPKPSGGPDYERALLKWITADAEQQIAKLIPAAAPEPVKAQTANGAAEAHTAVIDPKHAGDLKSDNAKPIPAKAGSPAEKQLAEYRRVIGGAVDVMIGRALPAAGSVQFVSAAASPDAKDAKPGKRYAEATGWVRFAAEHEELPAVLLTPASWNNQVAVWIDGDGKAGLYRGGKLTPVIKKLLDGGTAVLGVDLLYQGEFLIDGKPLTTTRRVEVPPHSRDAACFTYGYNPPVFAERVRDVLSAVSAAAALPEAQTKTEQGTRPRRVHLVGVHGGGAWVAAAKAQAGTAIDRTAIDTAGFRFAKAQSIDDPDFLPGSVKYLDLPGMLALAAPGELWLAGEGQQPPDVVAAVYKAAGASNRISAAKDPKADPAQEIVTWLLR
jgi:hypothetical protein